MGLFYLKVYCSIVKWENVLAFTNLTLYSNCNNGPVFFSLLHRSSCYNFFSHFLASLGNWIKDCPMVWSLFSERSLAVFKAGLRALCCLSELNVKETISFQTTEAELLWQRRGSTSEDFKDHLTGAKPHQEIKGQYVLSLTLYIFDQLCQAVLWYFDDHRRSG